MLGPSRAIVNPPPPDQVTVFSSRVLVAALRALIAALSTSFPRALATFDNTELNFFASSGETPSGRSTPSTATRSVVTLTPPRSDPSTTLVSLGMMNVSAVEASSSIVIHRRPSLCATAAVVPDPAKQSRTRSPGFVAIRITRSSKRSGLGVEKACTFGNSDLISDFAARLWPTSLFDHHVRGGWP